LQVEIIFTMGIIVF